MVKAGEADLVIAGGVESMTRAPWVMPKPERAWAKPGQTYDTALGWRLVNPAMPALDGGKATIGMGETAEEVASLDGITREEADAFALASHERAVRAQKDGLFEAEIVAVPTKGGEVTADEGPRADTSLERLAALRPVFRTGGVVTAGNSSPLNDGAAVVLIASTEALRRYGLTPRARLVRSAAAGVAPSVMGLGPVPATNKVLAASGWRVDDLAAVELNEAFAVQSLACIRRLGLDPDTVNADGGAIALGHPLGASGARILITLLGRLERAQAARGLATLCVGVGQGAALLVERV
jgi:acetyl-CoA acetyltransferase family protein